MGTSDASHWDDNDSYRFTNDAAPAPIMVAMRGFCAGCRQIVDITYPHWWVDPDPDYHCPNCGRLAWDMFALLETEAMRTLCEMAGIEIDAD